MGRHNLRYELRRSLENQLRIRCSKKKARQDTGSRNPPGIYSIKTLEGYCTDVGSFASWIGATHPDARHMDQALQYAAEYLQWLSESGYSDYTIAKHRSALAKAYKIKGTDLGTVPYRTRDAIQNNRGVSDRMKEYDESAYTVLVNTALGTGCRWEDLVQNARADSLRKGASGIYYFDVIGGKGGLDRTSPVLESRKSYVKAAFDAALQRGKGAPLFAHVPDKAPIHRYRRRYAQELYNCCNEDHDYRDTLFSEMDVGSKMKKGCAHGERYYCRGSAKGISYDRKSLQVVAVALGHGAGREGTVVNNYLLDTMSLKK